MTGGDAEIQDINPYYEDEDPEVNERFFDYESDDISIERADYDRDPKTVSANPRTGRYYLRGYFVLRPSKSKCH